MLNKLLIACSYYKVLLNNLNTYQKARMDKKKKEKKTCLNLVIRQNVGLNQESQKNV